MLSPGLAGLLLAPVLSAIALLCFGGRRSVRLLVWVLLALSAAWATFLVVSGSDASIGPLPGPLGSSPSWALTGTGAVLALSVSWLVVVWLAPLSRPLEDGPPTRVATCLILLSAVLSALLVDDLLVRVISLDLGSLAVCALLLQSVTPSARLSSLWNYALLMLGDLAFLGMALVLHAQAGTWSIDAALGQALGAPVATRWAILSTGLLAVWVKLALPPLGGWLRAFEHRQGLAATLVASAAPPLLGAYLLYRLRPLVASMGWQATALLLVAVTLSCTLVLWRWRRDRDDWATAQSSHALLGMALSFSPAYQVYLLSFVPIRAALSILLARQRQRAACVVSPPYDVPRALTRIAFLASGYDTLWTRALAVGTRAGLVRARSAALTVDVRGHQTLERAVLGVTHAGNWLSSQHGGKLRRSLLWALLGLLPVLLVLLLTSWEA